MKKVALAATAAVILCLFSGCAVTGGTSFLLATALTIAGGALLVFGIIRALQRRKIVQRSRRVSSHRLKKADHLTLVVFGLAAALLLIGVLLLAVNLGPLIAANNGDDTETTPQTVYEERELPWKTFPPDQAIASAEYFVYSCNTDEYLRSTIDADAVIAPAEFTTLFTAYVATECVKPANSIRVTEEALALVPAGAKTAGFIANQSTTAKVLVEALVVADAADAAYIVAVNIGSSLLDDPQTAEVETVPAEAAVARFVQEMNAVAQKLGMTATKFVNPDGSAAEGQVTTITDLITLSKALFKVETLMKYAATGKDTIVLSNTASFVWENTNQLVDEDSEYYCPYATGLKMASGKDNSHILLSTFESNGKRLIIGVMHEKDPTAIYTDALHLFNLTMGVY